MFEIIGLSLIAFAIFIILIIAASLRTVVSTNDVHIVQSTKHTVSFGKDQSAGNTYYAWPSWMPVVGVRTTRLPMSVFSENLVDYNAYDKERLPFVIDVIAFFRIVDSNTAAQRVASFSDLQGQLKGILQGAIRSILAGNEINMILEGRSEFGRQFTEAVDHQLKEWGVVNVKNIEFMDIRDAQGSRVIANIMAKKQSFIDMESRTAVASNRQAAETAEIAANQTVNLRKQEAEQMVGVRTAEAAREVALATQQAQQSVKAAEKETTERTMAVKMVEQVRGAEIIKATRIVEADQQKVATVTIAEGAKQVVILAAEGSLAAAELNAKGVQAQGLAKAEAEKALQLAPVAAQITLAKEIGGNENYQTYLIKVRGIEAGQVVGVEQAKALGHADIKIIASTGSPADGLSNVRELFTAKGGQAIGAMFEGLQNTETGAAIIEALTKKSK